MNCIRGSCNNVSNGMVDLAGVVQATLCESCTREFIDDEKIADLVQTWQTENRRLEVMCAAFSGPAADLSRAVEQVDASARARLELRRAIRDWVRTGARPLPS